MQRAISLDAGNVLTPIVESMVPGEEIVLTLNGEPKAVVTKAIQNSWPCQPGTAQNPNNWMAPDFDAPVDDFADYMK
jgi:hypothetical protein